MEKGPRGRTETVSGISIMIFGKFLKGGVGGNFFQEVSPPVVPCRSPRSYFTASAISSSTLARTASIISADLAQRENLISCPNTASISAITRSLP